MLLTYKLQMTTVKCFCGMALSYVCDGDQGALLE